MINIHEDELVLMIAKNNEEAMRLLFLIYEKKMRFEANNFEKRITSYYKSDDYLQELRINFIKILANYDYTKGRLYTFWLANFKYIFYNIDEKKNNLVLFDSGAETEYVNSHKEEINKDLLYEELHQKLDELAKENFMLYKIVVFWANGYRYEEISKELKISNSTINYYLKKGIEVLKKKMK